MAKIKVQTGLRLDEELYEKVKTLADLEGRSLNNLVEYIVRRYIADHEKENGPILPSQD